MTQRERVLETLLFGTPDRVPFNPGGGRESTRERWHREGLPEDIPPHRIPQYAFEQIGGSLPYSAGGGFGGGGRGFGINERMIPQFEEKVVEERENSRVVQDWKGNVCEIGKEYTVEYLRNAIDFVTRRWIKCPVENWDEWEAMKERYDPEAPERLPDNAADLATELADREHYVEFHFSGPFWQLREWLGFEELCVLFYDDPELDRKSVV